MKFTNKTYDILKWVALIGLPAFATFLGVVGATFKIPYTNEVISIIVAFDAMLGTMLGISTVNYNKELKAKIEGLPEEILEDVKEALD